MLQQLGSGKTTVLVERIINKVINEKIDIDKLLIVTFTNAAASEMRQRILEELYKKIEENPDDKNFTYLFLAVLGLRCCVGFSLVAASRGLLF